MLGRQGRPIGRFGTKWIRGRNAANSPCSSSCDMAVGGRPGPGAPPEGVPRVLSALGQFSGILAQDHACTRMGQVATWALFWLAMVVALSLLVMGLGQFVVRPNRRNPQGGHLVRAGWRGDRGGVGPPAMLAWSPPDPNPALTRLSLVSLPARTGASRRSQAGRPGGDRKPIRSPPIQPAPPPGAGGMDTAARHEEGPRPVFPLVRGLIGVVSGGGLEPPRPIKGTSTSS